MSKGKSVVKLHTIEEGHKGTKVQLKVGDEEFVRFSAQLEWKTDDVVLHKQLQDTVEQAATETGLHGLAVDLADDQSTLDYLARCDRIIQAAMEVLRAKAKED